MRVAVAGATGRMGSVAREALEEAGLYACGLARVRDPIWRIYDTLDEVLAAPLDALLDFTVQPDSYAIATAAVERGIPTVVGASGWSSEQREAFGRLAQARGVGALIVPNFSLGAALMIRFAREAARFFPDAEVLEMHRASKHDRPSGTALETVAQIGRPTTPIHSVRLPGLLAHQEVLFAGGGELLTIRHDSLDRRSFVPGMMVALRAVRGLRGLSVGLDGLLDDVRDASST